MREAAWRRENRRRAWRDEGRWIGYPMLARCVLWVVLLGVPPVAGFFGAHWRLAELCAFVPLLILGQVAKVVWRCRNRGARS